MTSLERVACIGVHMSIHRGQLMCAIAVVTRATHGLVVREDHFNESTFRPREQ